MRILQLCNFRPSISLLVPHMAMAVLASVILTRQFLSRLSGKNSVFVILWNKVKVSISRKEEVLWEEIEEEESVLLPPELWMEIGKRIKGWLDIRAFRSVCKIFQSCLPPPTLFPLQVPPPPNTVEFPFVVTQLEVYKFVDHGADNRLRVGFETVQTRRGDKFFEIFGDKFDLLKRESLLTRLVSKVRRRRMRLTLLSQHSFLSMAHYLRVLVPQDYFVAIEGHDWVIGSPYPVCVKKTVVISSPNNNINLNYVRASDLSVVAHLSSGRLALLRLGGESGSWTWDTEFCTQEFELMGTYKGQLCSLDDSGRLFVMDYDSLQMNQLTPPSPFVATINKPEVHLFEAFGDLYLSYRKAGDEYTTYQFSFQLQDWIRTEAQKRKHVIHVLCSHIWLCGSVKPYIFENDN